MASAENPFETGDSSNSDLPSPQSNADDLNDRKHNRIAKSGSISMDTVAKKLLDDCFVLTALELHIELMESGRELVRLRDYFSNPAHFESQCSSMLDVLSSGNLERTGSAATFDSAEFARSSDDEEASKLVDDRCAVLEFELRKSKETIRNLRQQLTQATASPARTPKMPNSSSSVEFVSQVNSIQLYEKRALNFLINEYLMSQGYKLTSVTFAEEAIDQDFDLWDDVGINMPRPENVLMLYKEFCHQCSIPVVKKEVEIQVDITTIDHHITMPSTLSSPSDALNPFYGSGEDDDLIDDSSILLNKLNLENKILMERNELLSSDVETLRSDVNTLRLKLAQTASVPKMSSSMIIQSPSKRLLISECLSPEEQATPSTSTVRQTPASLRDHVINNCCESISTSADSRLLKEIENLAGDCDELVALVSRCLPYIVPHMLLNRRDELLPLILSAAILHIDPNERDTLLNTLFNLIKKPDDEQRRVILLGCLSFAKHAGAVRLETELLPQCWEQMSHKYVERRVLVAEACGVLAPYVPPSLICSLILSMLQQMFNDKSEIVRETSVRSLAVVALYIDDVDKFSQLWDLNQKAFVDVFPAVVKAAQEWLLPAIAQWAIELGKFQRGVFDVMLARVSQVLQANSVSQIANQSLLCSYVECLKILIPQLFWCILKDAPIQDFVTRNVSLDIKLRFGKSDNIMESVTTFIECSDFAGRVVEYDKLTGQEWFPVWHSLEILLKNTIPELVSNLEKLEVNCSQLVHMFVDFCLLLCRTFGNGITWSKINPLFEVALKVSKDVIDSKGDLNSFAVCRGCLPVYIGGILGAFNSEHFCRQRMRYLKQVSIIIAESGAPNSSILVAVTELSYTDVGVMQCVEVVWELIVHRSNQVRLLAASVLNVLVSHCSEEVMRNRIVPGLVTLASDSDVNVKCSTLAGFGTILSRSPTPEVEEKVRVQLAQFFDDSTYMEEPKLVASLIRVLSRVAPSLEVRFRDEFVLPRLAAIAVLNNSQVDREIQQEVALGLFEVFCALSCCFMSDAIVVDAFLPGARSLNKNIGPEHQRIIQSIIKDLESKVEQRQNTMAGVNVMKAKMFDKFKDLKDKVDLPRDSYNVPTLFRKPSSIKDQQ